MDRTGWFETSDDLLNRLHRNAVWSMRGNFVGVPTDCPQRDERLGWTGDINAFAPAAAFLYDVSGVLGSWLQDLMAEQLAGGFVPMVVPNVLDRLAPPTALWADVAVSLPWLLYQEYGDLSVLERQYPSMVALMDSVEPLLDDGLWLRGFQFGDWLDPDAPPKSPGRAKTRPEVVASAYLCRTTRELASTAELLGRAADATRFDDLHARVRSAFRREWVTEAGLLVNETATAYALAICFGILEPDQEERAGRRLAQVVADSGYKISTGFAGTPFVMPALTRTGHIETAYRLLLQTEAPSFLYPVTMGATTIWERWDAVKPDGTLNSTGMTSLNHYALGAVVDWLHRVVGGLDRKAPGYRELRIAPQPGGGLRHVTTRRRTPFGEARVGWRRGEGRLELEVVVPPGSTAEVVLPLHPEGRVERVEAGEHRWSYEVPPDAPRAYTLDTSLRELASVPDAWEALRLVLLARVPESVVDSLPRLWPDSSPRQLLAQVPGPVEGLEEEMAAALARAT
jgi:alpha-L-rhamnosidase